MESSKVQLHSIPPVARQGAFLVSALSSSLDVAGLIWKIVERFVCAPIKLWTLNERILLSPFQCGVEGLWLQKLSAVVSAGPNSYLLISAFSLLGVSQKHLFSSACEPQLQETAMLSFRSADCNFIRDLCCHPAHKHFTGPHVTPTCATLRHRAFRSKGLNFIRQKHP